MGLRRGFAVPGAEGDGLIDEQARLIIRWCLGKIEAFGPSDEQAVVEYGRHLARQARTIAKIANAIGNGEDANRIQRGLEKVTADEVKQQDFLRRLSEGLTLDEAIISLLPMAEGG